MLPIFLFALAFSGLYTLVNTDQLEPTSSVEFIPEASIDLYDFMTSEEFTLFHPTSTILETIYSTNEIILSTAVSSSVINQPLSSVHIQTSIIPKPTKPPPPPKPTNRPPPGMKLYNELWYWYVTCLLVCPMQRDRMIDILWPQTPRNTYIMLPCPSDFTGTSQFIYCIVVGSFMCFCVRDYRSSPEIL